MDHLHYVALSRLQSTDGLFITKLQEDKITVNKSVIEEMKRLRDSPWKPKLKLLAEIKRGFKIAFLNASSMHRHFEDIANDKNICSVDIACFCETRFNRKDSVDDTNLPGFIQYRQDCITGLNKRPSYGLAVYTKYPFVQEFPSNQSSQGIEICVFKTEANIQITYVLVYKPPKKSTKDLCDLLITVHNKSLKDCYGIILGDFNIDWKSSSKDKTNLETLLKQFGYRQVITEPTTDYCTTIDLIFSNLDETLDSGISEIYYSDHSLVWMTV